MTSTNSEQHEISAIRKDIIALREDIALATRGLSRDLADRVTERGGRAARAVTHQIEEQPLITLLLAAAFGFIGARVLLR